MGQVPPSHTVPTGISTERTIRSWALELGTAVTLWSWKPIDAFTIDAIVKKAGSVVNATRLVVSRDGKALTITENGTGPNGRATHGVRVYKKR